MSEKKISLGTSLQKQIEANERNLAKMTHPPEPRKVTVRVLIILPFDKQELSIASSDMLRFRNGDPLFDRNFDYVEFVEMSAYEKLQQQADNLAEALDYYHEMYLFDERHVVASKALAAYKSYKEGAK